MSSDWSDTMVWFDQILLYLSFYHPIYDPCLELRTELLHHEPAVTQSGADKCTVDGEVENESDASWSCVNHGSCETI